MTCTKYLSVVKPLESPAEYENTKQLVENFQQREGPILQAYIQKRSWQKINWLADWWMDRAYLAGRYSIAINSNYYCLDCAVQPTTNQLARATNIAYYFIQFYQLCVTKKLHVLMVNDLVPICMDGYKNVFATCRIPGKLKDELMNFKDIRHVVVVRKGIYFAIDVIFPTSNGEFSIITPQELRQQLQKIYDITEDLEEDSRDLAALTSAERPVWAEIRERIMNNSTNLDSLLAVESALFHISLDTISPKDMVEQSRLLLAGDGTNRWFDVCASLNIFPNGKAGGVGEHSTADAPLYSRMWEYAMSREKYDEEGEPKSIGDAGGRTLKPPHKLDWELKGFEKDMSKAKDQLLANLEDLHLHVQPSEYGKGFVKNKRMSPDGYLQMALQLAYYRMHKEVPKTYESASTRMFAQGRTETIRPVTEHSVSFVKSIDDPTVGKEQTIAHLRKAIICQTQYKIDASNGYGCDRHMLGLYIASQELNMPIPKMFMDPICFAPDRLSTSQTPVKLTKDWTLETSSIGGGFGPVANDGYGISYIIVGEDLVNFHITSRRNCSKTDSLAMGQAIIQAMADMKNMLE